MSIDEDPPEFCGLGKSKSDARKDACEHAYQYLDEHDLLFTIRDEIKNPNEAHAINQLETLARRDHFSIPTYSFEQKYDGDGNTIWYCECHIEEFEDYYWAEASSKKEAKKSAAFGMLQIVLEYGGQIIPKYCLNYESVDYEWIDESGYSIDRGEYVYNWEDSEYRREEEDVRSFWGNDDDDSW